MVRLMERDQLLATLRALFRQAASGRGSCALVSGEAGVGKTALIERFASTLRGRAEVFAGACEEVETPTPLGALIDMGPRIGPLCLCDLQDASKGHARFNALVASLTELGKPVLMVIEDVHWADQATRELVRFLVRRLVHMKLLLVVSHRTAGEPSGSALQVLLGELVGPRVVRLELAPLSLQAVAAMWSARTVRQREHLPGGAHDARELHMLTAGNPLLVSELIASPHAATVRDSILGKLKRLPTDLQLLAEIVSVVVHRCEIDLLCAAFPDQCARALPMLGAAGSDLLEVDGSCVKFSKPIARRIVAALVAESMPLKARTWHRRILSVLEVRGETQPAWMVHHATGAKDVPRIRHWALIAGNEAFNQGAYMEAAKHFRELLAVSDGLVGDQVVAPNEHLAEACEAIGSLVEAVQAREAAIHECERNGWLLRAGHNLTRLGRIHWRLADRAMAMQAYESALARLNAQEDSIEYAWVCAFKASAHMTSEEDDAAVLWAKRALSVAEARGLLEVKAHALNTLGDAQQYRDERWREHLEQSLRISLENALHEHAARAYINLVCTAVVAQEFEYARHRLREGIPFAKAHGLDFERDYMRAWLARAAFERGSLNRASYVATRLCRDSRLAPVSRSVALAVLAGIKARRADADAADAIQHAMAAARPTREHQRIAPVLLAQAEFAWLTGRNDECADIAREGVASALGHGSLDNLGRFAVWLRRAGSVDEAAACTADKPHCPQRFVLELCGQWEKAARAWEVRGYVYEQALALAQGPRAAVREARRLLCSLHLSQAARVVVKGHGLKGAPPKRRDSTEAHPNKLTAREAEVQALLHLPNKSIAAELGLTVRTVETHVASILRKLRTGRAKAAGH